MANRIQFRRGLKDNLKLLSEGEPAYLIDTRELYMGTGSGNVNMTGNKWYVGNDLAGTSLTVIYSYSACPQVKTGDMYLNSHSGNVYQCMTGGSGNDARWRYKLCLKGAKGDIGTVTVESGRLLDSGLPVSTSLMYRILGSLPRMLTIDSTENGNTAVLLENPDEIDEGGTGFFYINAKYLASLGASSVSTLKDRHGCTWTLYDEQTGKNASMITTKSYIVRFSHTGHSSSNNSLVQGRCAIVATIDSTNFTTFTDYLVYKATGIMLA